MIPVILIGSAQDCGVGDYVRELLARRGGVLHISERGVEGGKSNRFLLLEYEQLPRLSLPRGILIMKQKGAGYTGMKHPRITLSGDWTGVVDSSHTQALDFLKESGIPAISCGMSARDTLTLSSITESSATVTLSRSLRTLSGNTAEPQDIPQILRGPAEAYAVMAGTAALLLAD